MKRIRFASAVTCGVLALAAPAYADDAMITGTVKTLQSLGSLASAPGNADFRVYLTGLPAVCPGANDPTWAYINANDANFKGVVATVTTAYAMGKPVTIRSRLTTIGAGQYCQIVWVMAGD